MAGRSLEHGRRKLTITPNLAAGERAKGDGPHFPRMGTDATPLTIYGLAVGDEGARAVARQCYAGTGGVFNRLGGGFVL